MTQPPASNAAGPAQPSDAPDAGLGIDPGAEIGHKLGIEFLEVSAQRLVARMPVEGNRQPYGLLHGGASCVLAESLGSMGAAVHAGPGRFPVGVDINATHHRAVTDGYVTGVATPLHLGRSAASYEIVISDDQDRRVCTARLTCFIRDGG